MVHKGFDTNEDVIGIYNVDNIKTDTLVTVIKGALIRFDIPSSNAFVFKLSKSVFGDIVGKWMLDSLFRLALSG